MPLQKLIFKPGVNREGTTLTNEGSWFETDKVRFRSGFPEKLGGWSVVSYSSITFAVNGGDSIRLMWTADVAKVLSPAAHIDAPIEDLVPGIVPEGAPYKIIETSETPNSRLLRNAWEFSPTGIVINFDKSKEVSHERRRLMRSNEFAPLDDIIMKKIPGNDLVAVEAQRQAIRDKYAQMQIEIDNAVDIEELTSIIERYQSNENN